MEGVNVRSLADICKPGFGTISKNRNDNGSNDSSPGDEGKTANSVSQDAQSAEGTASTGGKSLNVDTPGKGGSKEDTQITYVRGRFKSKRRSPERKGGRLGGNPLVARGARRVEKQEFGFVRINTETDTGKPFAT